MKLIGVGFGRSGTMSLKGAIEQLGAKPCFHMIDLIMGESKERDLAYWERIANGEQVDWHEVFDGWQATVDWPACRYWRELAEAFPDAPILLNHRDFDGFYKSCQNTILAIKKAAQAGELTPDPNREPPSPKLFGVIEKLIWQGDFQGRFEDREWVRQMYHDRIETIKREIPSDRLILWELGKDGWGPIADALGVAAPDEPFPHLHDTNEFRTEFGLEPLPA
ncbi:MAG: sulfotransferase family protein [Thermoleophilaceae bacterium]